MGSSLAWMPSYRGMYIGIGDEAGRRTAVVQCTLERRAHRIEVVVPASRVVLNMTWQYAWNRSGRIAIAAGLWKNAWCAITWGAAGLLELRSRTCSTGPR